ncbi:nucleotide exchange factor GrpE [Alkaliphilus sp. B6464]|uniref:nucleotide exchange factor GrpE n=1 Tax=Alkaliphilus sp. B6464 TaxID=2731219 RepID=UPI001BACA412|nr:nucleotide exchange factor GrpE [Alkaliphilus sp. B6464]QUH21120.1 nucleotide exchange factor GrpE [Alkaliphilus sp. B6464]
MKDIKREEVEGIEENKETANNNLEATLDEIEETDGNLKDLEEKLAEKTAEYEDVFSQFQRLQADFSNYKKRVEKEKGEIYLYANEKIASDLLNIIDNLERAIQSQTDIDEDNSLLEGINLVYKQLIDTLAKHGVEEIEALGKPFDMNLHYAVMQEETNGEANCVIDILQKGYKVNDRVLRPAMVKVSR